MTTRAKPAPATDLAAKFELFKSAIERRQHVGVRYWRVVEDPAVISLGGGIVSLATGTASYLDDDWVTLRAGDLSPAPSSARNWA